MLENVCLISDQQVFGEKSYKHRQQVLEPFLSLPCKFWCNFHASMLIDSESTRPTLPMLYTCCISGLTLDSWPSPQCCTCNTIHLGSITGELWEDGALFAPVCLEEFEQWSPTGTPSWQPAHCHPAEIHSAEKSAVENVIIHLQR